MVLRRGGITEIAWPPTQFGDPLQLHNPEVRDKALFCMMKPDTGNSLLGTSEGMYSTDKRLCVVTIIKIVGLIFQGLTV